MNRYEAKKHGLIVGMMTAYVCVLMGTPVEADFIFEAPTNLGPSINSVHAEGEPYISADGLSLYFSSNRPDGFGAADIWVSRRASISEPWGDAANLGSQINTSYVDATNTLSADGLSLYFTSNRPGGSGSNDIWVSTRVSVTASWGTPTNLGPLVNSSAWDARPSISEDGLSLYFSSNREKIGTSHEAFVDIYVATRPTINDPWSQAVKLGPEVNARLEYGNGAPEISAHDRILLLYSNRPGSLNDELSPCLSLDGSTLFFVSKRPEGHGGLDIWQASVKPRVDLNNDGQVNDQDMSILVDHWHSNDPLCDIGPTPWGDGMIDEQDLKILSEHLKPGFGRIAHWKLDETEGMTAYDSVGSYHAEVLGNSVWQPDAGVAGGALEFDGVDDCLAPALVLNPTDGPFRIVAWIKGGTPGQVIASQTPSDDGPGYAYLAADPADGTLITKMMLPQMPLRSGIVITDGPWHEVALEWDGEYRHLTIDGVEVAKDELRIPTLNHTGWLDIGKGIDGQEGTNWSGLMDEIRIYKKAVSGE